MTVIPITNAPRFTAQATDAVVKILRLPVAPQATFRPQFAPEAKAEQALSPAEALREVGLHKGLEAVELDGPGDPLATMATTLATIALLKNHDPNLIIGLTTLGFGGEQHATELAAAGLNRVTLLVETMELAAAEKLYAWIRPGRKTVPLHQMVPLLLEEQPKTVQAMAAAGMKVAICTTIYPGINAHQVVTLAETMAELGATEMELVPFTPDPKQTNGPAPSTRVHMEQISKLTSLSLATTVRQVNVAECGCSSGCGCGAKETAQPGLPQPSAERPRVAVVSTTGMDVDLHLGQAATILIYGPRADGLTCLLETRQAPEPGSGESRWEQLADTLHDCFALLAASAGGRPREMLGAKGIRVILTEENIEGTVDVLYGGGKKQKCKK
ncbi:NifB/NifX family molybdenum-iron cluster-binding protein [uncultured Desulfobulbus sp.]|uniref:NifB/NifX family molybdenum-iron cluster-binding protein n=1 Tax=uncultured Desulfobulbus sp. TaxID=239745 RepID=UPI0029C6FD28|nr:NifB/NifX family molybdenum-iron cluster-binding protein [uncultured Desulfobulbus sp.]